MEWTSHRVHTLQLVAREVNCGEVVRAAHAAGSEPAASAGSARSGRALQRPRHRLFAANALVQPLYRKHYAQPHEPRDTSAYVQHTN
jgi:hypothetical protein